MSKTKGESPRDPELARIERLLSGPSFRVLSLIDRGLRWLRRSTLPGTKVEGASAKKPSSIRAVSRTWSSDTAIEDPVPTNRYAFSRTSRIGTPNVPLVSFQQRPTVTVVVATFNSAHTIQAALWSILDQSYPVTEIVVADDSSTDGTRDVVARMAAAEPRIRLICTAENRGTFWAKNAALIVASGEVVTFLDSEDISMPKRIEMQLRSLSQPGVVASLCRCVWVENAGRVIMNRGLRSRPAPVSLMFHRSILRDIGYFDTVRASADLEFQDRLKLTYGRRAIHEVADTLYVVRAREDSLTEESSNAVRSTEGKGLLGLARQSYQENFVAWHAAEVAEGRRPYVSFPVSDRPFPVAAQLAVSDDSSDATSISAFMATYPPRLEALKQVVPMLIGQVDRLYIYLNGFDTVPDFLNHERVIPVLGHDRNLRDAGKFFSVGNSPRGFWFFVDDDLRYPRDYCDVLVRSIERHRRKAIVGIHGIVLSRPLDRYFSDQRKVYRYQDAATERRVNLIGTGTLAMHSSVMKIDDEALTFAGMADIYLGIRAKRAGVPMIIVGRRNRWLRPIAKPSEDATFYEEFFDRDELQTSLLQAEGDWTLEIDRLVDGARG